MKNGISVEVLTHVPSQSHIVLFFMANEQRQLNMHTHNKTTAYHMFRFPGFDDPSWGQSHRSSACRAVLRRGRTRQPCQGHIHQIDFPLPSKNQCSRRCLPAAGQGLIGAHIKPVEHMAKAEASPVTVLARPSCYCSQAVFQKYHTSRQTGSPMHMHQSGIDKLVSAWLPHYVRPASTR